MEQSYFRARAGELARIQARYLLRDAATLDPETSLSQALGLIRDCVQYLDLPALAIEVALGFHPTVERWATWSGWAVVLDMILTLDRQHVSALDEIRLLNCQSQTARELGDYERAMITATQALELAEAQHDQLRIAEALNKLGMIAFLRDDLAIARRHFERACNYGTDAMSSLELGHIRMNLGTIAMQEARLPEAHHHFNAALQYYQAQNDPLYVAKLHCNRAELYRREGRVAEVLPLLTAARDVFHVSGARHDYGLVENDLGCAYLTLRQWDLAWHAFQAAVAEFDQLGSLSRKVWVLSNVVELYVTTEQWDLAAATIEEAHELARLCDRPLIAALIEVDLGRMLAAQRNIVEARRVWESAKRLQEAKGAHLAAQATQSLLDALPQESLQQHGSESPQL